MLKKLLSLSGILLVGSALALAQAGGGASKKSGTSLMPAEGSAAPSAAIVPGAKSGAAAATGEFAGNEVCRGCHPAEWNPFYKNAHFKSMASGKEPPERTGCEGCHGPAKAHVLAGGGKTTIPRSFNLMKPAQIIETCLTCHAQDFNRANIRRSEHTQHDIACTNCHSNHHPATDKNLLAKSQPELCYSCHNDVRAQFDMPSKHRVNEGAMKCTDCHNSHGGFTPTFGMGQTSKMLNQAVGSEQPCMKCHVDKKGPFLFEHEVSQTDGCITCHKPHGSPTGALLVRNTVGQLCLECHTGTGNFAANNGKGVTVPDSATHSMLDPKFQRCTSCHVRIHGSNVHYRFLR